MPAVLLLVGIAVLVIGMRGRAGDAMTLLASEFTGPNSFVQWFLAITILGLVGYIKPARPLADGMLGLVILAMILAKGGGAQGFIAGVENAFQNTKALPAKNLLSGPGAAGSPGALQPFDIPGLTSPAISQLPTNQDAANALAPAIPSLPTNQDAASSLLTLIPF